LVVSNRGKKKRGGKHGPQIVGEKKEKELTLVHLGRERKNRGKNDLLTPFSSMRGDNHVREEEEKGKAIPIEPFHPPFKGETTSKVERRGGGVAFQFTRKEKEEQAFLYNGV